MIDVFYLIVLVDLSALIMFLSSCKRFGIKTASIELIITLVFALIFETYNITVNQHYSYPNDFFYIGNVSISVLLGWYLVVIASKYFTTLFLSISKSQKLEHLTSSVVPVYIIMTALIGAVFVTFFDPLATRLQWWIWKTKEPTPYLGIPIGEIYGVFLATSIVLTLIMIIRIILLKEKYIQLQLRFETLSKLDVFVILYYEIFCLVIFYFNMITSTSDSDVLMGTFISYLGTQIAPFIIFFLYISSGNFDEFYNQIYSNNKGRIISLTIILLVFTCFLSMITILATFEINIIILPPIKSLHMILAYFLVVCISFSYLLVTKLKEHLNHPVN